MLLLDDDAVVCTKGVYSELIISTAAAAWPQGRITIIIIIVLLNSCFSFLSIEKVRNRRKAVNFSFAHKLGFL